MLKRIGVMLLVLFLASSCLEMVQSYLATGAPGIAQPAEAIVGRPLTPVSVAGVGRRTVRRCAVGVC